MKPADAFVLLMVISSALESFGLIVFDWPVYVMAVLLALVVADVIMRAATLDKSINVW